MQYSVNQLYSLQYKKLQDVYEVFKNFFGEEYVDLQMECSQSSVCHCINLVLEEFGVKVDFSNFDVVYDIPDDLLASVDEVARSKCGIIYVWWSSVTVINEHDKYIIIQDLYAKIRVQPDGLIPFESCGFLLNRATYTREQFLSNYLHSHIREIPKDDFSEFGTPCLGQGPIAGTIQTLKTDFDEAEWMLFCQELSMYVTVESLSGGPWKCLESVGAARTLSEYNGFNFGYADRSSFVNHFPIDRLKDFVKYYIEHGHLVLAYRNGSFVCGMSPCEYVIDVSNAFIDFYNRYLKTSESVLRNLFSRELLRHVLVKNGMLYQDGTAPTEHLDRYKNRFVLKFKGKEIRTKIIDTSSSESVPTVIINYRLAIYILKSILRTINFKYKNEHNNNTGGQQSPAQACQKTVYI